jgi:hypothetical protein
MNSYTGFFADEFAEPLVIESQFPRYMHQVAPSDFLFTYPITIIEGIYGPYAAAWIDGWPPYFFINILLMVIMEDCILTILFLVQILQLL